MAKKKSHKKHKSEDSEEIYSEAPQSGFYESSVDYYPEPGGLVGVRKPRRNYWGNLYEEDTFSEEFCEPQNYDYADYDSEDDNDSYYSNDSYD